MRNQNGHPQNSKLAIYLSGSPSLNPRRTNAIKQEHDKSGKMKNKAGGPSTISHPQRVWLLCRTKGQVGPRPFVVRFLDHKQIYTRAHKRTNTHAHTADSSKRLHILSQRPLATQRVTNKTHEYPCYQWDSNSRSQRSQNYSLHRIATGINILLILTIKN